MTKPTFMRRSGDLPAPVLQMLSSHDWDGLVRALDEGLPANLETEGMVPLFEHVLFAIEANARTPEQVDVPPAPLTVLEAFLRNGLSRQGCYGGQATLVSVAVNYGQWDWAQRLIEEGFPVEAPGHSALASMTSGRLHRAISRGLAESHAPQLEDVQTIAPDPLVGGNVHAFPPRKPSGGKDEVAGDASSAGTACSLLFDTATEQGRLNDMVKSLVAAGADLQARTPLDSQLVSRSTQSHFPPIMHAIYHLDRSMVQALVAAGADLTSRPLDLPYRPLEMAITRGSAPIVEDLLAAGAPTGPDPSHESQAQNLAHPLVLCARMGLPDMVEVVGRALDEEQLLHFGVVAMHTAAAEGNVSVMRAVRMLGITYDAPTKLNGFKPIHQAAFAGKEEALAFLLRRGQRWNSQNDSGLSAQDVLVSHHPHLMERFGLKLPGNVRTLFGRKPRP